MSCDHDFHLDNDGEVTCRYCHIIKEVDEKSYISVRGNPLYKTTFTGIYNNINQTTDQAEKQIPGLTAFLSA